MSNEELISLLKELFPSKEDHQRFYQEFTDFRRETRERFNTIDGVLAELKASARALDVLLAAHILERLARIEKHLNLPKLTPSSSEDD